MNQLKNKQDLFLTKVNPQTMKIYILNQMKDLEEDKIYPKDKRKIRKQTYLAKNMGSDVSLAPLKVQFPDEEILRKRKAPKLPQIKKQLFKNEKNQSICIICCQEKKSFLFGKLTKCQHYDIICGNCLKQYVTTNIKNGNQIKCPVENCFEECDADEPFILILDPHIQKQFRKNHRAQTISKDPLKQVCFSENCEGIIQINKTPLQCSQCGTIFCKDCLHPSHLGKCENNQLNYFHQRMNFRQCSKCKHLIEKAKGCEHMKCICGHYFCFLCGSTINSGNQGHLCQKNVYPQPIISATPLMAPMQVTVQKPKTNLTLDNQIPNPSPQVVQSKFSRLCNCFFTFITRFMVFILTLIASLCFLTLSLMVSIFSILLSLLLMIPLGIRLIHCSIPQNGQNQYSRTQKILFSVIFPILLTIGYYQGLKITFRKVQQFQKILFRGIKSIWKARDFICSYF